MEVRVVVGVVVYREDRGNTVQTTNNNLCHRE